MSSLWNASTLVLVVVILLAVFIGYQRGLIRIVFSLTATILTLVLASVLFQPVNYFLTEQIGLQDQISESVQIRLEESTGEQLAQIRESSQNAFLKEVSLPSVVTSYLVAHNNPSGYVAQGVSNFAEYVSSVISLFLVRVIAFAATFVVVRILLYLILSALRVVEHLPGVKSVNHMGGAIVSLAELLLVLWLFCALAAGFSGTILGGKLQQIIGSNLILGFLYQHNLLLSVLSGVLGL